MGAIKDVVDLATRLCNSVQDRKIAAEIFQIQSLILTVQNENTSLASDNLDLKNKVFELEKKISDLQMQNNELIQNHSAEIATIKKRHIEQTTVLNRQEPEESPLTFGLRNKR